MNEYENPNELPQEDAHYEVISNPGKRNQGDPYTYYASIPNTPSELSAPFGARRTLMRVKLLRSEVCFASILAHFTSLCASAQYFTAAPPLLHLAQPNFTESCGSWSCMIE